jgi:hypothetical protein
VEDADQVHDDVRPAHGLGQPEIVAEVGDDRDDLADLTGGLQEQRLRRVA